MTYKQLQVFVALVQENSFSGAAQKLNVTQPAISWQLKSLENELGVILLERDTRGFILTEAGSTLYQNALTIVNQFALLSDHMAPFQNTANYRCRIASTAIPGEYVLPKFIQPFLKAHPDLYVKVEISNSTTVIDKVLKGELSLGIVDIHPKESELETEPIASDELIAVASPKLQLDLTKSLSDTILENMILSHVDGHRIHKLVQDHFDQIGLNYEKIWIPYETGSIQASVTAAMQGSGIVWLPRTAVTSALQCGALVELACAEPIPLNYYLIHHSSRSLTELESALKKQFSQKQAQKN